MDSAELEGEAEAGYGGPDDGVMARLVALARRRLSGRRQSEALDVTLRVVERHRQIGGSLLAGALAYRFFLVTMPLTLIAMGLLGFAEETAAVDADEVARRLGIGGLMARVMRTTGAEAGSLRWFTLVGGVVLLLWATLALLRALRTVHAFAWGLPVTRLRHAFQAAFVAALVMLWSTASAAGVNNVTADWPYVATVANVVLLVAYAAVWVWLARYLPSRATRWTQLLPGAVVFALGVKAVHLFTAYYVAPYLNERAATYGVLGYVAMALLVLFAFGELAVVSALTSAAVVDHQLAAGGSAAAEAVEDTGSRL